MITYFRAISLLALNGQRLSPLMNRFLGVLIWRWSSGRAGAVSQNDGARKRVVDIFVSVMMFPMEMGGRGGGRQRARRGCCVPATSGVSRSSLACIVFAFMGKEGDFFSQDGRLNRGVFLLSILQLGEKGAISIYGKAYKIILFFFLRMRNKNIHSRRVTTFGGLDCFFPSSFLASLLLSLVSLLMDCFYRFSLFSFVKVVDC